MNGEPQKQNDLFYTCSLIEYIARKTKNTKKVVIQKLGQKNIQKIYELAEVYHCEDIEKVSDEFIVTADIRIGDYDHVTNCKYTVPSYWDIGKVYKRLIIMVAKSEENYLQTLIEVLSSWIVEKIDNYNSSMYYENPSYIYECYMQGKVL